MSDFLAFGILPIVGTTLVFAWFRLRYMERSRDRWRDTAYEIAQTVEYGSGKLPYRVVRSEEEDSQ